MNRVMIKLLTAAACVACDPQFAPESEQGSRTELVQCLDPTAYSQVRMIAEVISEDDAEGRIATAGASMSAYACESNELNEDEPASNTPRPPTNLDLSAPPAEPLAGFCIEVCCGGKFLCFQEK